MESTNYEIEQADSNLPEFPRKLFLDWGPAIEWLLDAISVKIASHLKNYIMAQPSIHEVDEILNIEEAAKFLRTSPNQIYQWVHKAKYAGGNFPFRKTGKRLKFSRKDLERWSNLARIC